MTPGEIGDSDGSGEGNEPPPEQDTAPPHHDAPPDDAPSDGAPPEDAPLHDTPQDDAPPDDAPPEDAAGEDAPDDDAGEADDDRGETNDDAGEDGDDSGKDDRDTDEGDDDAGEADDNDVGKANAGASDRDDQPDDEGDADDNAREGDDDEAVADAGDRRDEPDDVGDADGGAGEADAGEADDEDAGEADGGAVEEDDREGDGVAEGDREDSDDGADRGKAGEETGDEGKDDGDKSNSLEALARTEAPRLINVAQAEEKTVTTAVKAAAARAGGRAAGLKDKVKGVDSLTRKLVDRASEFIARRKTPEEAVRLAGAKMNDVLRYTVELPPESYASNYPGVVSDLQAAGFQLLKGVNAWDRDAAPFMGTYRGINTTFKTSTGMDFEVQFHTKESFTTKSELRGQYEEWRDSSTSAPRRAELAEEMRQRWSQVTIPPGATGIKMPPPPGQQRRRR